MAGVRGGMRIRTHVLRFQGHLLVALSLIFIWINLRATSYAQAQSPPGFLSVDCGGPTPNYTDPYTNLFWVNDSEYILSGNTSGYPPVDSGYPNAPALASFRYFQPIRSKYCYELPTTPNSTYMLRVMFYYNTSLLTENLPLQFILNVNASAAATMTYDETTPLDELDTLEGIFYSPGGVLYVCLQPVVGLAFISSLELRLFNDTMYTYAGSRSQYLARLLRYNTGANYNTTTAEAIRWPEDQYDRFWDTPPFPWATNIPIVSRPTPLNTSTGPDSNFVPPAVMQDAWYSEGGFWISFTISPTPPVYIIPADYVYAVIYAENVNSSGETGQMFVSLDESHSSYMDILDGPVMNAFPSFILSANAVNFTCSRVEGNPPPVMNAVEIYAQYNFNFSTTSPNDAEAIAELRKSFYLLDWQGDPCTPVPHDWISCSLTAKQGLLAPCTSGNGDCEVQPAFLRSTYYVSALRLSTVPVVGFVLLQNWVTIEDIALSGLQNMTITNSSVDGLTFSFMVNNFTGGLLQLLDFSQNTISGLPLLVDWILPNLVFFNLSQNLLAGALDAFNDVPFAGTLQTLDLSSNAITSFTSLSSGNRSLRALTYLDLSHNLLDGDVSSLSHVVQANAGTLLELYVNDNNLTGTFPSQYYFSSQSKLKIVNFDRNSIQGTLNLTDWFAALMATNAPNSTTFAVTSQLFSFINNSISGIIPSADAMGSTMYSLLSDHPPFMNYGLLLAGNPYCQKAKAGVQQYLCRSTVAEPLMRSDSSNKDVLIIGIVAGVVALLLFVATAVTIWRLWKQMLDLRSIQRALAEQKVQPPFYQFSELKSATKDFNEENKLGQGGFGIVYKGTLSDKSEVAVKKLFNSSKLQVMNEFLNEVVLITGIKHRNLVQLKGCCIKDKERMLVYEYAEKGNLSEALWGAKSNGGLDWEQRLNICVGVARGLSYLHEELQPSIIHRDIKPANVLLDKNFKPKIADFGLAKHFSEESSEVITQIAGTLGYFSPEYASQGQLSEKADVYSYGIVVLEIVSGRKCIDNSQEDPDRRYLKDWVQRLHRKGLVIEVLEPALRDHCVAAEVVRTVNIALLCVQQDPEERPAMSQVVTMLLGNMEVEGPGEESSFQYYRSYDSILGESSYSGTKSANLISLSPNLSPHLNGGETYTDSREPSRSTGSSTGLAKSVSCV